MKPLYNQQQRINTPKYILQWEIAKLKFYRTIDQEFKISSRLKKLNDWLEKIKL